VTANFGQVAAGQSVEGLGAVVPDLNINANGTAVKVAQGAPNPLFYVSPNAGNTVVNDGLEPGGGFSDGNARLIGSPPDGLPHLYTFTFGSGVSVSDFSLHMLDFGDLNPSLSTAHHATMTAYDGNGAVVSTHVLDYTTPPERNPTSSDIYGNLGISGDATGATPGQPGNWTWHVSGTGIVRVVLDFGVLDPINNKGYDPNIAFDNLVFARECPQP